MNRPATRDQTGLPTRRPGRAAPPASRAATLWSLVPSRAELVPWTDKKGRFHVMRAVCFALLLAPAAWLLFRWAAGMLGARQVNTAIHSTGYATIWILVASLVVTPFKALAWAPNVVVLRRMIGNAALLYGLLHISLYVVDENWRLGTVVSEILHRFYLTIGFVALSGLIVLGLTSTEGWARYLGRGWKRLHRVVYAIAVLGLVHYMLQSKIDVSQALLADGVFTWLMIWRLVPAGRDREWPTLLVITVAATLLTLIYEYAWYRFGTHVNPMRVLRGELDIDFGLQPGCQMLVLGLLATAAAAVRQVSLAPFGATVWFTVGVYALGGLVDDGVSFFVGWDTTGLVPGNVPFLLLDVAWMAVLAIMGVARWKLRQSRMRHLIDAAWLLCVFHNVLLVASGNPEAAAVFAGITVFGALLLGGSIWRRSPAAALTLVPASLLLVFEAVAKF